MRSQWRITCIAVLATVLSMFPLIFQHKSLMSPNIGGAVFLYDQLPTLPNYTDTKKVNEHGADVGAMPWQFFAGTVAQAHSVQKFHEFPLWHRYNSSGTSQIAQGQMMLGDPFNWLMWGIGATTTAFDMKFVLLRFVFALSLGLGVWTITRELSAALLVTFSAPFIGYFIGRLNHAEIFTLCYAPLIILSWLKLVASKQAVNRLQWVIGLMISNWLVLNSGSAKELFMTLICFNGIGLTYFVVERERFAPYIMRWSLLLGGTGLCFIMITLPIWGVFLDALRFGTSSYASPAVGQSHLFETVRVVDNTTSLIMYQAYGLPALNLIIFMGLVFGIMSIFNKRAQETRALAIILGLSMLLFFCIAFKVIPAAWIIQIPFINNIYHVNMTFTLMMIVPACLLAGIGFASIVQHPKGLWVPTAIWLGLLGLFCLHAHGAQMGRHFLLYVVMFLPVLLLFPRLWVSLCRQQRSALAVLGVLVLLFIGLGRFACWPAFVKQDFVLKPPERVNMDETPPLIQHLYPRLQAEPQRVIGVRDILLPGANAIWDLENISGPDAMMNKPYRALIEALQVPMAWYWRILFETSELKFHQKSLDFLGVGVVLAHKNSLHDSAYHAVTSDKLLTAYARETVWPRAFYTDHLQTYDSVEALAHQVRAGTGRPFVSVSRETLQQNPGLSSMLEGGGRAPLIVKATAYTLTNNTTSFTVTAPAPGVVYLGEVGEPRNFEAVVNGQSVPIIVANYAFKAVMLPQAGTYRIAVRYWPYHFTCYLVIAVIGLGAWILLLGGYFVWLRRSKSV